MKKRTLMATIIMAGIILVFAVVTTNSQDNVKSVQDSAFRQLMRPTVPFQHDEHNEKAELENCNTCHHILEEGKLVEDESSEDRECSECHVSKGSGYPMPLVKAYHMRCKGCHLEKKSGPIMCGECHVK